MVHVIIHIPRCSGHARKNQLISSLTYRLASLLKVPDNAVHVIIYESEFRTDTASESCDFILGEAMTRIEMPKEARDEMASIFRDEAVKFSGIEVDKLTFVVRQVPGEFWYGRK